MILLRCVQSQIKQIQLLIVMSEKKIELQINYSLDHKFCLMTNIRSLQAAAIAVDRCTACALCNAAIYQLPFGTSET